MLVISKFEQASGVIRSLFYERPLWLLGGKIDDWVRVGSMNGRRETS